MMVQVQPVLRTPVVCASVDQWLHLLKPHFSAFEFETLEESKDSRM